MKVLMVNGSPHKEGSTYTALSIIAEELARHGVESEIFHVGNKPIGGCLACGLCRQTKDCRCAINDIVNEFLAKAEDADGYVFGTPVYFAAASGQITSLLNRAFYAGRGCMAYKPACSVVCERRAGASATYDQLNKYIGINNMIQVPSKYWNMMIGRDAASVMQDKEGVQIMTTLAQNMAWMLEILALAKLNGLQNPSNI